MVTIRMYSNFIQPHLSAPICCFLSVNISIVGPQSPVYLHQHVKLKWVLSAKYKNAANTVKCELRNKTLFFLSLKVEPNRPDWVETQHGVTANGIIINKNLKEDDEGMYCCTHTDQTGHNTIAAYNLTSSGKSAQEDVSSQSGLYLNH